MSNGVRARGRLPPLDPSTPLCFAQDDEAIVLVEVGAEGLPVARFQRLSGGAVFPEQDHAAVQAFHVQLAVDIDAVGPEGGPQAVIDVPFPDVFFEQVVAGAALDLHEGFLALDPGEYRGEHGVRPPFGGGCPDRGPGFFKRKYRFYT